MITHAFASCFLFQLLISLILSAGAVSHDIFHSEVRSQPVTVEATFDVGNGYIKQHPDHGPFPLYRITCPRVHTREASLHVAIGSNLSYCSLQTSGRYCIPHLSCSVSPAPIYPNSTSLMTGKMYPDTYLSMDAHRYYKTTFEHQQSASMYVPISRRRNTNVVIFLLSTVGQRLTTSKTYINAMTYIKIIFKLVKSFTVNAFYLLRHINLYVETIHVCSYHAGRQMNLIMRLKLLLRRGHMRRHEYIARVISLSATSSLHVRVCGTFYAVISRNVYKFTRILRRKIYASIIMRGTDGTFRRMRPRPACFRSKKWRECRDFTRMFIDAPLNDRFVNKDCLVGGGRATKSFLLSEIDQYVEAGCDDLPSDAAYKFVAHVSDQLIAEYTQDKYVHAKIPLHILVRKIPVLSARQIVRNHGIKIGSHTKPAEMSSMVQNHSCYRCAANVTVLSVEHIASNASRVQKHRTAHKKCEEVSVQPQGEDNLQERPEFPPSPADDRLILDIVSRACTKMDPINLEESGCAVCGQLKPIKTMSALRTVKNLLHVLHAPGITRVERKTAGPLKEFQGPVLDYTCSRVCKDCRVCLRKGNVPRFALANGLWIGKVPTVLANLRFVEKLLIARIRHTCAFVKIASGGRKMQANVVAFESPVPKIYKMLPPPREDMDDVLAILFTGPCRPTMEELKDRTPFFVRRKAVMDALNWLKLNHDDYFDIEISDENMQTYSELSPPVSIEYRPADTNKVQEGTSVFDTEKDNGTSEGQCSFTVHGLTGEALNTMSTSRIKAMALRHMNNQNKFLAVGHSQEIESIWNNTKLYTSMYPWLFPYGLGGVGTTDLSDKAHKRFLLMYHDKRFQSDIDFPFVAFSHEQIKATTTQSFLLIEQRKFKDMSERLLNLDPMTLQSVTERLSAGDHVVPETDQEKACFQVIKDLDSVASKSSGSITQKKFMRNEIWSLIAHKGAPVWYVTLSPADTYHPICIYYAGTKEEFKPDILPYDERVRVVCRNPVAAARFFHFIVRTFISDVLGVDHGRRGIYGETDAYYGTVEQQGRLTLHLHMMIWIKGCLSPQEMRKKLMEPESEWHNKVKAWLESCHTGDFITGTKEEVLDRVAAAKTEPHYIDPTQTLPNKPPKQCDHEYGSECAPCGILRQWWNYFYSTIDDLISRSNIHNCNRNSNSDGTARKGSPSGCMSNKWGICKSRFPRDTFPETVIDKDTGGINMKKREPWINTFTPLITYLFDWWLQL